MKQERFASQALRLLAGATEREVFEDRDRALPSGLREQIQTAAVSVEGK